MVSRRRWSSALGLGLALAAIVAVTAAFRVWLELNNATIAALTYLLVILVAATVSTLWVAIAASVLGVVSLNFFFMPPVGTFIIADPQNWVALFVFLAVSVVASNLSSAVRDRAREAMARRDELARLFDLSRDVLLTTDGGEAISQLARFVSRRFALDFVAICLPRGADWDIFDAGALGLRLDPGDLSKAFAGVNRASEVDAHARTQAGHRDLRLGGHVVRLVPLRLGARAVGLLAAAGRAVEEATLDAIAGVAAIAIERAHFLDERKAAELARHSEELKSALLASLGHDLRTPLTAIRVAAGNLQASWPNEQDRREQSEIILAEVDQLTRLFQNILEMARIDAGAVTEDRRWVAPPEIVEGARSRVEHALRGRVVDLSVESERLVRLDPRLTAAALSHLLENAAQYAPAGSPIDVTAAVVDDGLTIAVRDHGPGIPPSDLPHVFERFYRGRNAEPRRSGTGMGLAIAKGMLAVERGTISAENCADGGARFRMVVPAEVK